MDLRGNNSQVMVKPSLMPRRRQCRSHAGAAPPTLMLNRTHDPQVRRSLPIDVRSSRPPIRRIARKRIARSAAGSSRPAEALQLVDGLRPVLPEQAREARDRPAAGRRSGSAGSSWSRCRRSGCAARRCRRPGTAAVAAVHRHVRAEGGHLLGKPSPSSARRRSIQSASVARVASYRRAISSAVSCSVMASGDSRARCRISSE